METAATALPTRAALDRARRSRDARFDGRFFVGVTSTGIYCRPVCPAPSPRAAHVRYFPTAAAAADAGFRPCLRCRPEAAPGTPAWLGTSAVVRRGLALIDDGALDGGSVDALAGRLGIGPRQLHRLFVSHVGAPPLVVAQTRRLHFAKRLIDETDLPITEIALASGFGSLRRFNAAFRGTYDRPPSALRRLRRDGATGADGEIVLRLPLRPPYDLDHLLAFLAARALPGVERVDACGYARTLALPSGPAVVRVRRLEPTANGRRRPPLPALELRVDGAPASALFRLTADARRTFDLAADPAVVNAALSTDPLLRALVQRRPGLRIPGAWDPFECAVRAVLGQQVSIAAARTLAVRLLARAGTPLPVAKQGLTHLFPSAAALARANLDGLGLTSARVTAIQQLARAVVDGRLDLRGSPADVVDALRRLPGFGAWTAAYVALRGLGEPDAFPAADLVLRRAAGANGSPLKASALLARAEAWRPWRGYAVFHLWAAAGASPARAPIASHGRVTMRYDVIETPIGPLLVAADDRGLRQIRFPSHGRAVAPEADWVRDARPFRDLARQLAEYFERRRQAFELALAPQGTEFQLATWRALRQIPYGTTISYGELARRVGRPSASRAVGAANGANPLPIVVPCHRVIGKDGSLTGFGGGLPIKRTLLELEQGSGLAF